MNRYEEKRRGVAEANVAREELYATLGQLKEQLNYAKRFDRAVARGQRRISEVKAERPLVFVAGVTAVAAVAGGAVWAIVRCVTRSVK